MDLDMDMVDMQLDADADFDLDLNLDFEREFAADTKGWISDWQVLSFDASCRSSVMAVEG
jgi:hypothetical protein